MRNTKFRSILVTVLLFVMLFTSVPFTAHASEVTPEIEAKKEEMLLDTRASLTRVIVPSKYSDSDGVGNAQTTITLANYIGFSKELMVVTTPKSGGSVTGSLVVYVGKPDGYNLDVITMGPREDITKKYSLPSSGTYTIIIHSTCNVNVEVAIGWL